MNINVNRLSLRNRFTIACVVLSLLISLFFSVMIYTSIHSLESILIGKVLSAITEWQITSMDHLSNEDQALPLPSGIFLYAHPNGALNNPERFENKVPEYFKNLEPGFHEVITTESDFLAYVKKVDGVEYVAALDQTEFELLELKIYTIVLAAIIVCVLIGGWTGYALFNLVISPINRLSEQVKGSDPSKTLEKLSSYYGDDVVGDLASAFDHQLEQIQYFLMQEKLFTSDVSHELRTPLTVIAGAADVLLNQQGLADHTVDSVRRIKMACDEMLKLINAFLYLSRENPKNQIVNSPVSINQLVAQSLVKISETIDENNVELEFRENNFLELEIKPELLTIVIDNLLRNALNYAKAGAIQVAIDKKSILIKDSGPGIPEAIINQVFLKKGRVDESIAHGNGMGLAIAKRICDLNKWQIEVVSKPRQGASFVIKF